MDASACSPRDRLPERAAQPYGDHNQQGKRRESALPGGARTRPIDGSSLGLRVLRVGLSGEDELHGAVWARQNPHKPVRVMQKEIRTLVRSKATRKTHRERVAVERSSGLRKFLRRSTAARALLCALVANVAHERLTAV